MEKTWRLKYKDIDKEQLEKLRAAANLSKEIASILIGRGITADNFLQFAFENTNNLHDPFLMKDMDKAVSRIKKAMEEGEHITVYGDYDVDGISATVLLLKYFKSKGVCCDYYIPDRESEGYGVNREALKKIKERGTSLVITVDTGITACDEVLFASDIGLDVIVTDHHMPKEELPMAKAVVNPKRNDCGYPFKELSGTGVAFKLMCALEGDIKKIVIEYCDIVALATVADVVSLLDENRIITALGLRKIKKMPNNAIRAVMKTACVEKEDIEAYHFGFYIAPRINAAGRMGEIDKAIKLFMAESEEEADEVAAQLNEINNRRKDEGNHILEEAVYEIEKNNLCNNKVIVLAHENWHHGIIGITASRLAEMYDRSVILISLDAPHGKGSGRAALGLNLFEALSSVSHLLIKFGGHAAAAGLTIEKENIDKFRIEINRFAQNRLTEEDMIPVIDIDMEIDCKKPLLKLADELQIMEPFGVDNEKPVFSVMDAEVTNIRTDKSERHLLLKVKKENTCIDCIGFGCGELKDKIKIGEHIDIAARLNKNTYANQTTAQLHIADIKEAKCNTHTRN